MGTPPPVGQARSNQRRTASVAASSSTAWAGGVLDRDGERAAGRRDAHPHADGAAQLAAPRRARVVRRRLAARIVGDAGVGHGDHRGGLRESRHGGRRFRGAQRGSGRQHPAQGPWRIPGGSGRLNRRRVGSESRAGGEAGCHSSADDSAGSQGAGTRRGSGVGDLHRLRGRPLHRIRSREDHRSCRIQHGRLALGGRRGQHEPHANSDAQDGEGRPVSRRRTQRRPQPGADARSATGTHPPAARASGATAVGRARERGSWWVGGRGRRPVSQKPAADGQARIRSGLRGSERCSGPVRSAPSRGPGSPCRRGSRGRASPASQGRTASRRSQPRIV